jgi:hypothetical protein
MSVSRVAIAVPGVRHVLGLWFFLRATRALPGAHEGRP